MTLPGPGQRLALRLHRELTCDVLDEKSTIMRIRCSATAAKAASRVAKCLTAVLDTNVLLARPFIAPGSLFRDSHAIAAGRVATRIEQSSAA
jgi:hypothetical protein